MFCELTKCCFCFPLRKGLIAFGYCMSIFCYINLVIMLCMMNDMFQVDAKTDPMNYIMFSLAFGITAIQLTFHVIMLFGLHKNSEELLGAYLECNICMFVTQVVVSAFYIPLQTYRLYFVFHTSIWKLSFGLILVAATCISIQFYLISLVRSQLRRLRIRSDVENATGIEIGKIPLVNEPEAGPSELPSKREETFNI